MKKGTAEKETGKEGEDRVCERTKERGMNGGWREQSLLQKWLNHLVCTKSMPL